MSRQSPQERYLSDPMFYQFTNMLESFLHKAEFTPSEIRECAILACIHYELKSVKQTGIVVPESICCALDIFKRWSEGDVT